MGAGPPFGAVSPCFARMVGLRLHAPPTLSVSVGTIICVIWRNGPPTFELRRRPPVPPAPAGMEQRVPCPVQTLSGPAETHQARAPKVPVD